MSRRVKIKIVSVFIPLLVLLAVNSGISSFWAEKKAPDSPGPTPAASPVKLDVQVPDVLISLEPDDSPEYAFVVEKDTQQLFLFGYDNGFKELLRLDASTGEVRGPKKRAGDSKTPEGVYFFTKEHLDQDLAPIYGSRAYPMDYPNALDKVSGLTGNSIWLHGSEDVLKPRSSNGCVALANNDIDHLSKYIKLNRTPIIVVKKLSFADEATIDRTKRSILTFLSHWKASLEQGTYHEYLKHYDQEYIPDISWWSKWLEERKRFKAAESPHSVELRRRSIFMHDGVFVVLFDQVASALDRKVPAGIKKLFIAQKAEGLKIIGEEFLALPEKMKDKDRANPLVAAYQSLEKFIKKPAITPAPPKVVPDDSKEIARMVDEWLKAWSAKDIKKYGEFYTSDFRSQGKDLKFWLAHKARLNRQYKFIRVTKDDTLTIKKENEKRNVSFVQTYVSSGLKAVGIKQLVLKREDGQWKIYRETWKKI
ncbi:MAG: L,D-transpeptidase family protein [Desulfobacterales bacterium]|nr:L,D-transpeptidase family protein [Desulfobacterales bacterium]